jgi:hypothetical protein
MADRAKPGNHQVSVDTPEAAAPRPPGLGRPRPAHYATLSCFAKAPAAHPSAGDRESPERLLERGTSLDSAEEIAFAEFDAILPQ